MPLAKAFRLCNRLLASLFQLRLFLPQPFPGSKNRQHGVRLVVEFVGIYCGWRSGAVIAGVMLRFHPLYSRLWISSHLLQIFRGSVELVLVKISLRFGDLDLILQVVFWRVRGGRKFTRQEDDVFLIFLEGYFGLVFSVRDLLSLRAELGWIFLASAQSIKERQVHFTVGNFFGLMGEELLFWRCRQTRHPAGCFERALIDQRARRNRGTPCQKRFGGCFSRFVGFGWACFVAGSTPGPQRPQSPAGAVRLR